MSKRKINTFVERSILSALSFLKGAVYSEENALKKGLLQSIDPRVKTLLFLFLIFLCLITKNLFLLTELYLLCLGLAYFSQINLFSFLARTLFFIPIFSLFIALPALFSFITPGAILVELNLGLFRLIITKPGLLGASTFVLRVTTSVSYAVLLSITTKHFEFQKALRALKVPSIIVTVIGMCYRYVFLFTEIIENTFLAIKSRTGSGIHYQKGQHLVAWNIAHLWMRSYQLSENVYQAMLSRGYRGIHD